MKPRLASAMIGVAFGGVTIFGGWYSTPFKDEIIEIHGEKDTVKGWYTKWTQDVENEKAADSRRGDHKVPTISLDQVVFFETARLGQEWEKMDEVTGKSTIRAMLDEKTETHERCVPDPPAGPGAGEPPPGGTNPSPPTAPPPGPPAPGSGSTPTEPPPCANKETVTHTYFVLAAIPTVLDRLFPLTGVDEKTKSDHEFKRQWVMDLMNSGATSDCVKRPLNPRRSVVPPGSEWTYPVPDEFLKVTDDFGTRPNPTPELREGPTEFHQGIDLGTPMCSTIFAARSGVVKEAGPSGTGFGTWIQIEDEAGGRFLSIYGHLEQPMVTVNQRVEVGDPIGYSGSTGRSTGPHLHYELHENGVVVNPRNYLPPLPPPNLR